MTDRRYSPEVISTPLVAHRPKLAAMAVVERLTVTPAGASVTLEHFASLLREHHGVVPIAGHANGLDEPLLAQMSKVHGPRVGAAPVVIP